VNNGSRSWIRYRLPFRMPPWASVRLLPVWLIHNPDAASAIPAISTLRVDSSMKNNTRNRCGPRRVYTSTVKKSAATISSQGRFGNSFQVVLPLRSGAGSMPCRRRISAMVVRPLVCPRLESAPWIFS